MHERSARFSIRQLEGVFSQRREHNQSGETKDDTFRERIEIPFPLSCQVGFQKCCQYTYNYGLRERGTVQPRRRPDTAQRVCEVPEFCRSKCEGERAEKESKWTVIADKCRLPF